jgi:hypothetical protein
MVVQALETAQAAAAAQEQLAHQPPSTDQTLPVAQVCLARSPEQALFMREEGIAALGQPVSLVITVQMA